MNQNLKKLIPNKYKSNAKRFFKNVKDSFCYFFYKKNQATGSNNITFVCKGNICRSVFAELYLKKIDTLNLYITSCGLDVGQDTPSPSRAVQVAAEFGVDMNSNISTSIDTLTLTKDDHIIVMEFDQYQKIIQKYPQYKNNVRLLKDYMPWPQRLQCNISDPYGGDIDEFRRCFNTIKRALDYMVIELSETPVHH